MHFSAKHGIAMVIMFVCYIREPWLNRLMFSENNINSNWSAHGSGSPHYTAHLPNSRGTSPNFGWKTGVYVQKWHLLYKWHLRYKTSDISETKQSRAKLTMYRVSTETRVRLIDWWQIWWPRVNFNLLFRGAKFFQQRISCTLFVGAQRNLATLGVWPIKTYSSNFVNFSPGVLWYHAATCIPKSFNDALVKWFFNNFPMLANSFSVLSIHYVAWRLRGAIL